MIIDAHTHIFPDPVARKALRTIIGNTGGNLDAHTNGTREGLLASMDAAGIDRSIVLTVATSPNQGDGILQWIRESAPLSDRLIYFGSIHPLQSNYRDCIREMAAMGIQGIKFHPGYQNFAADAREALDVYEEAARSGMVMYFHAGFDPSLPDCDYTSIERFASFLRSFRGAKIILAHGGGYGEWGRVRERLGDVSCYYDIAFVLESMRGCADARQLYRQNEDYFIFGTDSPWGDQISYVSQIHRSDTLTPEQREKLFSLNIRKLLNIPGDP